MDRQPRIVIEPVTANRWDDLVDLFERPGPRGGTPIPGSCWCMAYRDNGPSTRARKQAMHDLVATGRTPGLIAYADGVPVAWVAVAPRSDHARPRSRLFRTTDGGEGVFSIT